MNRLNKSLLVFAAATLVAASSAHAADGTWITDLGTSPWTTTTNWAGGTVADGSGSTAFFTNDISANNAVTLSAPQTIGNLFFDDAGATGDSAWTISGSTLTLAGGTPTITTNTNATISSILAGNQGLTKTGTGVLTLSGANTYTGTTTVSAGVLSLNGSAPTIAGNLTMNGPDQTYVRMQQANQFAPGVVANFTTAWGTWNRFELRGNNQTLAGINTGNAGTQGGGVIQIVEAGTLPAATLTLNGSGNYIFNGHLRNGGTSNILSLIKTGSGTQTLVGAKIDYTGATTVSEGTLVLSGTTAFGSAITNNATVEFNGAGKVTGALSGTGTFNKTGSGIFIINPNGTVNASGQFNIQEGTLQNDNNAVNWSGNKADIFINTGAILDLYADAIYLDALTGSGFVQNNYGNAIGQSGSSAYIEKLVLGTNNGSGTFNGVIRNNATDAAFGTGGVGKGGIELVKTGTGTQTLTGANTYTGATTVNGGTLDIGGGTASGSISSGSALVLGGGTLAYTRTGGTTQTFNGTTINAGASAVSVVAGNTVNLGAITRTAVGGTVDFGTTGGIITSTANTNGILGGYATFGGNTWAVANGASAITGLSTYTTTTTAGVTAANYAAGNIDVDSSVTLDGAITPNSLRFNTAAANTLTLTGTNTISSGGILVTGAVGNNLSSITGGTLVGAAGKDLVVIQNNTANSLTIGSIIANNGTATGLTKSGAGTLVLSGSNTYTGATNVNAGTLIQDLSARSLNIVMNAVTVASGAVLELKSGSATGADSTYLTNTTFAGAGTIRKTGTGYLGLALTNANLNAFDGTFDVQAGTIAVNNGIQGSGKATVGLNVSGTRLDIRTGTFLIDALNGVTGSQVYISHTSGGTLSLGNNNGSGTFNGTIINGSSALALIKNGTGTQTLTGANTYTGTTAINAGTLELNYATNLSDSYLIRGAVTGTGTLLKTGAGWVNTTGAIFTNFAGNIIINEGVFGNGFANATWTNSTAKVTIGSSGTFDLRGANAGNATIFSTLSGTGSVVNTHGTAGTLQVGSGNASSTFDGNIYGAGGGTANGGSSAFITANRNAGTIALTKIGTGTFTLTGANTYAGGTTISAGTLLANNSTGSGLGTGAVAVNAGILGGTGFITGGLITVASGATLQGGVGAASGTLTIGSNVTLASGSIIRLALGASGDSSTLARTDGTWSFDANQTFDLIDLGVTEGGIYTLITGLTGSEAGLSSITTGWNNTSGLIGAFSLSGNNVIFTAVPEPSTYGLIGAGALAAVAMVRRRRKLAGSVA